MCDWQATAGFPPRRPGPNTSWASGVYIGVAPVAKDRANLVGDLGSAVHRRRRHRLGWRGQRLLGGDDGRPACCIPLLLGLYVALGAFELASPILTVWLLCWTPDGVMRQYGANRSAANPSAGLNGHGRTKIGQKSRENADSIPAFSRQRKRVPAR